MKVREKPICFIFSDNRPFFNNNKDLLDYANFIPFTFFLLFLHEF